ncbi:MAG: dephospho-CoA kinase, partial [Thermodesulfobacteriota bacterium]
MKVIGLTGNIASGKSLVASMLETLGAKVIDFDDIARKIVEPG